MQIQYKSSTHIRKGKKIKRLDRKGKNFQALLSRVLEYLKVAKFKFEKTRLTVHAYNFSYCKFTWEMEAEIEFLNGHSDILIWT